MTTIQIDEDSKRVQQFLDLAKKKFHFNVRIIETSTIQEKNEKTKWGEFAEKMSGLLTPETAEHIRASSKEIRDNFELRTLETK